MSAEHAKSTLDIVSIGISVATLIDWLPTLAALASLVWTCIRIYEYARSKRRGVFLEGE